MDEDYVAKEMLVAFPELLVKKYGKEIRQHRLHRELAATQIANGMVNLMGMNFVARMEYETGASPEKIARAYLRFQSTGHKSVPSTTRSIRPHRRP